MVWASSVCDGEHVFQITSKIFRPELLARVGASEPGRDAHNVAGLAHTSLDQMRHAEFLPDLLRGRILAFEGKRRGPRGDMQPGNFLQHSQQLLTDAVGKIFAPLVVAEIGERQHGDGLGVGTARFCDGRAAIDLSVAATSAASRRGVRTNLSKHKISQCEHAARR